MELGPDGINIFWGFIGRKGRGDWLKCVFTSPTYKWFVVTELKPRTTDRRLQNINNYDYTTIMRWSLPMHGRTKNVIHSHDDSHLTEMPRNISNVKSALEYNNILHRIPLKCVLRNRSECQNYGYSCSALV